MPTQPITVAETGVFVRQAASIWDEAERLDFIDFIARNPEAGDVIPATGGVRVIYFYHDAGMPLYLLMIYAKAQREDLSPEAKRTVRGLVARLRQVYAKRG